MVVKMCNSFRFCEVFLALIFLVFFIGCSAPNSGRFYIPKEVPIRPGMILKPEFRVTEKVAVLNSQEEKTITLGSYTHKWRVNLRQWTDTAAGLLRSELEKRGARITEDAPRILKLSVTDADLVWKFRDIACTVNLRAETGDGYSVNFEEMHVSCDLYDSCDGAITEAVADMFADPEIIKYISQIPVMQDSDGDGVPDTVDECPKTPEGVTVDTRGCPLDSDKDGVPDYVDECPKTPLGAKVNKEGCWIIENVLFDFDKYDIKPRYYSLLDQVLRVLKQNPSLKMELHGHADIIGTSQYNQKLSERRANEVLKYFVKKGVDRRRLSAKGFGYRRPIAPSHTEWGRALNRRVEFVPLIEGAGHGPR